MSKGACFDPQKGKEFPGIPYTKLLPHRCVMDCKALGGRDLIFFYISHAPSFTPQTILVDRYKWSYGTLINGRKSESIVNWDISLLPNSSWCKKVFRERFLPFSNCLPKRCLKAWGWNVIDGAPLPWWHTYPRMILILNLARRSIKSANDICGPSKIYPAWN